MCHSEEPIHNICRITDTNAFKWHLKSFLFAVFLIVLLALLDKLYSGAIQITDCIVLSFCVGNVRLQAAMVLVMSLENTRRTTVCQAVHLQQSRHKLWSHRRHWVIQMQLPLVWMELGKWPMERLIQFNPTGLQTMLSCCW